MEKQYEYFIKESISANIELQDYINNKLTKYDFFDTGTIGAGGDRTKKIDLIAEQIFVKHLNKFGDILSEESGFIKSNNPSIKDSIIILDPIDGSDNLISNLPYYGTSISLSLRGKTIVGLVYNLVTGKYIFRTEHETNNIPKNNQKSNFGIFERAYTVPNVTIELKNNNLKFRSPGATALSFASASCYQFFLFAGKPRQFDIDAGLFISSHLNIYKNDNFLLASCDTAIFETIKDIIKGY